jgi:hypothetical protein
MKSLSENSIQSLIALCRIKQVGYITLHCSLEHFEMSISRKKVQDVARKLFNWLNNKRSVVPFDAQRQIIEYIVGLETRYKRRRVIFSQSSRALSRVKEFYKLIAPYKVE